jgi:hypothetical protein
MGAPTSLLEQVDDRQRFLHERHAEHFRFHIRHLDNNRHHFHRVFSCPTARQGHLLKHSKAL